MSKKAQSFNKSRIYNMIDDDWIQETSPRFRSELFFIGALFVEAFQLSAFHPDV